MAALDKPTARTAFSPFDDPKADLIIRTSNNLHFYVHKSLLSIVSPVFEDMLALPCDSSQELYDNLPCLTVSDDSSHLYCLLQWCDPRCKRPPPTLNNLAMALEIADKYGIDSIFKHAQQDLLAYDCSSKSEPLSVFAIAVRFRLDDVARKAARATLQVSLANYNPPELKHVSAFALQNLHNYHSKCKKAAQALLASDSWAQRMQSVAHYLISYKKSEGGPHTHGVEYFSLKKIAIGDGALWVSTGRTSSWWSGFMETVIYMLNEVPAVLSLSSFSGMKRLISLDECDQCRQYGYEKLGIVAQNLAEMVNEAVSKVTFELKY